MSHRRRTFRAWCRLAACAAALAAAYGAHAQPAADPLSEAKRLFKAGARAYEAGKYRAAYQAFDQAYELAPRPELRFSAAQALRRLYTVDADAHHLVQALGYYRDYLAAVPQGGRRLDATQGVEEIERLLGAAPLPPPESPPADGPSEEVLASTLIVDSPTEGAEVRLDDEPPTNAPLVRDIRPGRHRISVTASGFAAVDREVETIAGRVKSLDIELEETPATLQIAATDGVDLVVDGKPMGETPFGLPLSLPSGRHRIVAGKTGYQVAVHDVDLLRAESRTLEFDLAMTPQRVAAWTTLGVAAAGASAATVLSALAFWEQGKAIDLEETQETRPLTVVERDLHNGAIDRRDDDRRWATITAGFSATAAVTGVILYLVDQPQLYAAAARPDASDATASGTGTADGRGATVTVAPAISTSTGQRRPAGIEASALVFGCF